MKNTFTVTRRDDNTFMVETDIFLSDLTYAKSVMELTPAGLFPVRGFQVGYMFHMNLGPVSRAKVESLTVGQTVTL